MSKLPERDDLVLALVGIWSASLETNDIRRDSNFLELGGASLEAVKIRAAIRGRFQRDVGLFEVIEHPTPQALADILPRSPVWIPDDYDVS